MLTYGLNRPLFSFGLSYPGYFFVVIQDGTGLHVFKVYEAKEYMAYEALNLFNIIYGNNFVAYATKLERLDRVYYELGIERVFYPGEIFEFLNEEANNMYIALGEETTMYPDDLFIFTASEDATFIVEEASEYNL